MTELAGKVALITGSSRGIGAAIARRYAAEGARVALAARTKTKHDHLSGSLAETLRLIREAGGEAEVFPADLSKAEEREHLVQAVQAALGPVDILVNNAAANTFKPFAEISEKRWQVIFEVNCRAPFDLAQRLVPTMREKGQGWIINISSGTAMHPEGPPFGAFHTDNYPLLYAASKAALDRFSTGLAAELYRDGIAVNALMPVAAVLTPGTEALGYRPAREELEGEEVMAEAALALATCEPERITGRVLKSGTFLEELGRAVRTLDGKSLWDGRIPGYE